MTPTPSPTRPRSRFWSALLDRPYRPGTVLAGRYAVERTLGMGSYGISYVCRDLEAGTLVVVKHNRPSRAFVRGRGRPDPLRLEAELLGRLDHPRIPRSYGLFRSRGRTFLAMECKEGRNLEEWLDSGEAAFGERDALELVADVAAIVGDLHAAGIVHRDVRPPNVILIAAAEPSASGAERSGGLRYGAPHLVDFGLARPIELDADAAARAARLAGRTDEKRLRRERHPRSDLYALGHLLLFLLYSTFDGESATSGGASDAGAAAAGCASGPEPETGTGFELRAEPDTQSDTSTGPRIDSDTNREASERGANPLPNVADPGGEPSGWEEELTLAPATRKLLRRLLQRDAPYESPYESVAEFERDLRDAIAKL